MATFLCRDYLHRAGAPMVGYPKWLVRQEKTALTKFHKRVVGVLKDVMKRKGGQLFAEPVDPEEPEVSDYFEKVRARPSSK